MLFPYIDSPNWTQPLSVYSYTRTSPSLLLSIPLFLSLNIAPIATLFPSLFKLTECPNRSFLLSPYIDSPNWSQPLSVYSYTRTSPSLLSSLFLSLNFTPIATLFPSLFKLTEYPN